MMNVVNIHVQGFLSGRCFQVIECIWSHDYTWTFWETARVFQNSLTFHTSRSVAVSQSPHQYLIVAKLVVSSYILFVFLSYSYF